MGKSRRRMIAEDVAAGLKRARGGGWIMVRAIALTCGLAAASGGCATLNPVMSEERSVSAAADSRRLNLPDYIVFYDRPGTPMRGIRMPKGGYDLEAEDAEYLYFRAPQEVEYRIFERGETVEQRTMPGGIALGKTIVRMVPAAVYVGQDEKRKVLTWKLGREFLGLEGAKWTKNF